MDAQKTKTYCNLSVWVRPNKTRHRKYIKTFSDSGCTGKVTFGIHEKKGPKKITRFYINEKGAKKEGLRYQKFWQKHYDRAITHALKELF